MSVISLRRKPASLSMAVSQAFSYPSEYASAGHAAAGQCPREVTGARPDSFAMRRSSTLSQSKQRLPGKAQPTAQQGCRPWTAAWTA